MEKLTEHNYLKERSLLILNFFIELYPEEMVFKEFIEVLNSKINISGLRMLSSDLSEWTKDLSEKNNKQLHFLLKEKFGEELSIDKTEFKTIKSIIKNKKIMNEYEFHIIKEKTYSNSENYFFSEYIDDFIIFLKEFESK